MFIVIGITDAPHPYFAPDVMELIRNGRIFSGGRRHRELVASLLPDDAMWIDITVPLAEVWQRYRDIGADTDAQTIIVFASGDPLFFGFAVTLRREFPHAQLRVLPTLNSLQLLAHRLYLPYHDMRIVSLTGRPWHEFDRALIERAHKIGILTDREHTPAVIAKRMMEFGYTHYEMSVGVRLGNPTLEAVSTHTLYEASQCTFDNPNCVILNATGSRVANDKARFGLPDNAFALLDGRAKMITKMPIRLLTLQALNLSERHVLWDIGACTGSVSIEARLLFPHLHVVAFEIRPECEAIILENARRHGAPGIELHIGDFLEIKDVMAPDAVFIGGHGGRLKEIMAKVVNVIAPGGVIVMNSVTSPVVARMTERQSSRQLWDEACSELGLKQKTPIRIALDNFNPIEILKAEVLS